MVEPEYVRDYPRNISLLKPSITICLMGGYNAWAYCFQQRIMSLTIGLIQVQRK